MSNERMRDSSSDRLAGPVIKALGIHLVVVLLLFVSFSSAPEFEPAKPIVQATLVQLNSKSPATTQTDQRIAGEAERTAAQRHEAEELEKQQQQQQEQAAARAAEQRQAEAAAQETEQKAAEEQKTAAERRQAEQVEKQKADEARRADAARKLAEDEAAKKRAEDEAKRKAAEEAKRKEDEAKRSAAAAEAKRKADAEAKAKAEADRVAKLKREQEEARATALADLLSDEPQYQQAPADRLGDQVVASYEDLIRRYVSQQWRRPPTARNGMLVVVRISMLPTGDITDAVVVSSSGDPGFDQAAIQAVRNVGRIPEMQQLSRENPAEFDRLFRQPTLRFRPEDLDF